MTDLIISRGDTFPRSYLDTYRNSKVCETYYDLKSSRSDELVLQAPEDIPIPIEIHHGHSENLLDTNRMSPTESEFLDKQDVILLPKSQRRRVTVYDKVDPEDSIRDMVSENDFYRFVLFKQHYDKYLHLSQKYEETRNIAYYLEEKYYELKTERDGLLKQRDRLTKRLESSECLLKEKEDEVFVQYERVLYLEEQCDKLQAEKQKCIQKNLLIEKERDATLKLLKEQARESESNRRKLEKARQEVFRHMTKIKNEKENLEKENDQLKEALEAERKSANKIKKRIFTRASSEEPSTSEKNETLTSQFQKAMHHLTTCKRKKCSVCAYTKAAFGNKNRNNKKLFSCLQTPFLEVRNILKPPPSPIRGGMTEGESLSEWFCPLEEIESECSSLSLPFAELAISYMDETSDSGSRCFDDNDVLPFNHDAMSHLANNSTRGFGSDSGFSSDVCADYKSDVTTPKEKFSPKGTLDDAECAKLTRTKWTASFRKLIHKIKK